MAKFHRLKPWSGLSRGSRSGRLTRSGLGLVAGLVSFIMAPAYAENARFDLTGPKVEVRVTRAGVTLPIASVPNLQPGDKLWLHPDLPPTQSVRYLGVLTFLRGTTNPPPENWFTRIETWQKKVREEGVVVTVPDEAQQAVLFLAPVTGGDFSTLRSAVQGRPGIFVRASQDLAAAGFEQARIEKYIASMKRLTPVEAADPKTLQEHSNSLAATLSLRPNGDCVKLPADQQYTCLTQSGSQNLLDDGHGQTIVDALTSGTSAGLIGTVSTTQLAGGGVYSAYVGAVVDLVHIMGSLHTAQYQYIPAIAFPQQQAMNLRLNTPPSFHNPKSVIVIGLPSVQSTVPPPLRAADPKHVSCLVQPDLVLPLEGAPLVFSTAFAHDLVLHVNDGSNRDIPLSPDAFRGGLVVASTGTRRALPAAAATDSAQKSAGGVAQKEPAASGPLTGTIRGFWGFDRFTGPTMPLQAQPGQDWKLSEDGWLIAGKHGRVQLTSTGTACIEDISLQTGSAQAEKQTWKESDKPNRVEVSITVPRPRPAAMHLEIRQYGEAKAASLPLTAYADAAKIEAVHLHAGDDYATLDGSGLAQVREMQAEGIVFRPAGQPSDGQEMRLVAPARTSFAPGTSLRAEVTLEDGRKLPVGLKVEPARPSVALISRAAVPATRAEDASGSIKLGSENDLLVNDTLVFSVKAERPFPRDAAIELGTQDGSMHAKLTLDAPAGDAKSSLVLQSPTTLVATVQPLKLFGPSAFGPIRFRAVAPDGTAGDWIPLVTLVRLPDISGLTCPKPATQASGAADAAAGTNSVPAATPTCTLAGANLYLVDSISTSLSDPAPVKVPEGFVGTTLAVPPPPAAGYFIRLRDDPAVLNTLSVPAEQTQTAEQ